MKRAFAAIGIAIFAASASAQSAPSTADFVRTVAISDMFEIESSKLALEKKVAAFCSTDGSRSHPDNRITQTFGQWWQGDCTAAGRTG
jgi:hypothetical protein